MQLLPSTPDSPGLAEAETARGDAELNRRQSKKLRVVVFLIFACFAAILTDPVLSHATTRIPRGTESADTVPLFNLWTLLWNIDRSAAGLSNYWDAPIFFPATGTFGYSEPQPLLMLLAPLAAIGSDALLYNVFLLGSLVLNGVFGWRLFRQLRFDPIPAIAGGLLIQAIPFVHWQLGVLQLVPLWGILWVLTSLAALRESTGLRTGVALGIAMAVTYACCNHYAVFLAILLLPAGVILIAGRLRERRLWMQIVTALTTFGVLIAPLAVAQWDVLHRAELERTAELVESLSALPRDYVRLPHPTPLNLLPQVLDNADDAWPLSTGFWGLVLAACGSVCGLRAHRYRAWCLFAAVLGGGAFLLSMGPRIDASGVPVYASLRAVVPGYAQIRNVYRYCLFVQLASVFLGTTMLQLTWERLNATASLRRRYWSGIAWFLAVVLVLTELWPAEPQLLRLPWRPGPPEWCRFIAEQTSEDAVLACLPLPPGGRVEDFEQQTAWMLAGFEHRRRMINGYSGFIPSEFQSLAEQARGGLTGPVVEQLRELGVTHVVAKESWLEGQHISVDEFNNAPSLRRIFRDDGYGIRVYELVD